MGQVIENTTQHFDGMLSLMNPQKSWVAKWKRYQGALLFFPSPSRSVFCRFHAAELVRSVPHRGADPVCCAQTGALVSTLCGCIEQGKKRNGLKTMHTTMTQSSWLMPKRSRTSGSVFCCELPHRMLGKRHHV